MKERGRSKTSHKGSGHGSGPMVARDLHAILEDERLRKKAKRARRIERNIRKEARHGKKQLPGGSLV